MDNSTRQNSQVAAGTIILLFVNAAPASAPAFHDPTSHRGRLREGNLALCGVEFAAVDEGACSGFQKVISDALASM
jgi:hypothetical protein